MGYATNRYFKPAVFTPIITEVEAPYRELFEFAKYKDAKKQSALADVEKPTEPGTFLKDVYVNGIGYLGVNDSKVASAAQSAIDNSITSISSQIAAGGLSGPEYTQAMNQLLAKRNEIYGPNGTIGIMANNYKAYQEGEKTVKTIGHTQERPWLAADWELQKLKLAKGEIQVLDPNFAIGKYINYDEELNKIYAGAEERGYDTEKPGKDGFIHQYAYKGMGKKDATALFDAKFTSSEINKDLTNELAYNVAIGMAPEKAQKIYETKVNDLREGAIIKWGAGVSTNKTKYDEGWYNLATEKEQKKQSLEKSRTIATVNPFDPTKIVNHEFVKFTNDKDRKWFLKQKASEFGGSTTAIVLNPVTGKEMQIPKEVMTQIFSKQGLTKYTTITGISYTDAYGLGAGSLIGEIDITNLPENIKGIISESMTTKTSLNQETGEITTDISGKQKKSNESGFGNYYQSAYTKDYLDPNVYGTKERAAVKTIQFMISPDEKAQTHFAFTEFLTDVKLKDASTSADAVFVPPADFKTNGGGVTYRNKEQMFSEMKKTGSMPTVYFQETFTFDANHNPQKVIQVMEYDEKSQDYKYSTDSRGNRITVNDDDEMANLTAAYMVKMKSKSGEIK